MTVAAWFLTPLLFLALTAGVSLGFERVARVRLPDGGLVPFGFCALVVVALFGFWVGLRGGAVTTIVCVLALAGWFSVHRSWREHLARRSGLLAFAGAYGLYLLPVLATGEWTWTGYNFVNDTAVQMLLAEQLRENALTTGDFAAATSATGSEVVRTYVATNYPVGSHAVLAVLDTLVPARLAPLYQPFLALLGATAAMALSGVLERAGAKRLLAAVGAILAVAGNLTYQYALQGNVKELGLIATLAAAALVGEAVVRVQRFGLVVALGVCGAAMLCVYSAPGAPYLAVLLGLVVLTLAVRRVAWRWLLRAAALAALVLVVAALPTLLGIVNFGQVASGVFATQEALQNDLGHLLRPLKLAQLGGVWLTQDYRIPVLGTQGALTDALLALVLVTALVGLVTAVRRLSLGVLFFAVPVLVSLAVLEARVSPYANGKLLAIAAVGVMLLAWTAITTANRHHRGIAAGAGAAICLGVLWSDAVAYHGVKLAPTERMASMRDVGERLAGRGLVLVNEPEEFAKFFFDPAQVNASTEAITPRQVQLRSPQGFGNRYFDLDEQRLDYIEAFPWVVTRRSPDASRPPGNFGRVYANAHYVVWKKSAPSRIAEHLPLQGDPGGLAEPNCDEFARLARVAGPGGRVVAAVRPAPLVLDTATAERSPAWAPHPYLPGMVITGTPGTARATVTAPRAGRYRAWVKGSFGRAIDVTVDGRRIGSAKGVNNLGQWHASGEVRLDAGRHVVELRRGGGSLAPGDGYLGELGPLHLTPLGEERLRSVPSRDARSLCGGSYDWIEAVRG